MRDQPQSQAQSSAISRRFFLGGTAAGAIVHRPPTTSAGEYPALMRLARRICGPRAAEFIFEKTAATGPGDSYTISTRSNRPLIQGSSISAMAAGLNAYLRIWCHQQISWTQHSALLPGQLPLPTTPFHRQSPCRFRYHFNYCTFSYTAAFWTWPRWQRQLDWMALSGVNLALAAVIGQQCVWRRVLRTLGVTDRDIGQFIAGPAFEPWWLMDNLEGWGGPVWNGWIEKQRHLQHKILTRMHELGIAPVLQGFYGMVPHCLKHYFPKARILDTGIWAGTFPRPPMLMPDDPLFGRLAALWYKTQENLLGKAHYFGGDPFHEGTVPHGVNLAAIGEGIQTAMQKACPGAVWVLQGWQNNPRPELLHAATPAATLVLDLFCDGPQGGSFLRRHNWSGHPWVWSIINDFGGNIGLFGQWKRIGNGPAGALNRGRFSGIGAMMEAQIDYPNFQLLFDTAWHNKPVDLKSWTTQYCTERYGRVDANAHAAWQLLRQSIYDSHIDHRYPSIFCIRPDADITIPVQYDNYTLVRAWRALAAASGRLQESANYLFDLTDVTRQVLANLAYRQYRQMLEILRKKDMAAFNKAAAVFMGMLHDQDVLLATRHEFMLGRWIADARSLGATIHEKNLLERNARLLITTWGPKPWLADYACHEWSGLLSDFYAGRWNLWINRQQRKLRGETPKKFDWFNWEKAWSLRRNTFASRPQGDSIRQAALIEGKYADVIKTAFSPTR